MGFGGSLKRGIDVSWGAKLEFVALGPHSSGGALPEEVCSWRKFFLLLLWVSNTKLSAPNSSKSAEKSAGYKRLLGWHFVENLASDL